MSPSDPRVRLATDDAYDVRKRLEKSRDELKSILRPDLPKTANAEEFVPRSATMRVLMHDGRGKKIAMAIGAALLTKRFGMFKTLAKAAPFIAIARKTLAKKPPVA